MDSSARQRCSIIHPREDFTNDGCGIFNCQPRTLSGQESPRRKAAKRFFRLGVLAKKFFLIRGIRAIRGSIPLVAALLRCDFCAFLVRHGFSDGGSRQFNPNAFP